MKRIKFHASLVQLLSACVALAATNAIAADNNTGSDTVYFSKDWCPHAMDLAQLDKYMSRVMDGCCISAGYLFKETKDNPSVLSPWKRRIQDTPVTGSCTGTPSTSPEAPLTKEELEAYEALEKIRLETEKELEAAHARLRRETVQEFVGLVRKWDRDVFCYFYGKAVRGEEELNFMSAEETKKLAKKEAARRKLSFNDSLILDEKIKIGVSQCQMYAAWGEPKRESRSVGPWGVHIQHVYGDFGPFVYTENGRVKSFQD